jgi:hypothetical protein
VSLCSAISFSPGARAAARLVDSDELPAKCLERRRPAPGVAQIVLDLSAIEAVQALDLPTVGVMEIGGQCIDVPRAAGAAPVASATGHIPAMALFAGQGVGTVTEVRPAATIIAELATGAENLLLAASPDRRRSRTRNPTDFAEFQ